MTTIFFFLTKKNSPYLSRIEYNRVAVLVLPQVYRKFNRLVPGYPTDSPNMTLVCLLHKLLAQGN